MTPQSVLGCPACGMRITGTESECPRCHQAFGKDFRFECPFCGGLIPKGSERCPICQIDVRRFSGHDQQTVEQKTDSILEDLINLESNLIKQEQKRYACPNCAWLLSGEEEKCPKCGRSLTGDANLTCPVCMGKIRKDATECSKCGAVLRKETAAEVVAPPKPAPSPAVSVHTHEPAKVEPRAEPAPPASQPPPAPEESTDEALEALGQIAKEARGPRTRTLKAGKVTVLEKRAGGGERGISNGLGQTNGTSMVNGRSKINGTGRVNGTGAVNGRSLVNGTGLSNGLRSKGSSRPSRRLPFGLRWQLVTVLVAIVAVVPTIFYFTSVSESGPIRIDGNFDDWAEISKSSARIQSGLPSVDIAEWALLGSGNSIYLYARTQAEPMAADALESVFLFMDTDGSASTGYLTDGIGADYLMQINGWNGSVQSTSLEVRSTADQYDWNAWTGAGSAVARVKGTGLEARCELPQSPSESTRAILVIKDSADRSSASYASPLHGGLLVVTLEPTSDVVTDGVVEAAESVGLLNARFTCQGSGGTVTRVATEITGANHASQISSFSLTPGSEHVVVVTANTTASPVGRLVTAEVLASGINSSFAAVQIVGEKVGAYVASAPQDIVIDGAFGDWIGKTTVDEDSTPVGNANIDIDSTGNYSMPDSACFYVSVKGELGKGTPVPAILKKPSGTGGGQVVPVRKTGEDFLRIYIDSDRSASTGQQYFYDTKMIGADHKVELAGVNGVIVSSSFWNYSGGQWVAQTADLRSAKDVSQIEISVPSRSIGGLSDIDFIVETTSWKNQLDMACFNPTGTRAIRASISSAVHTETFLGGNSNSPWATSMSYQRKLFWDGTNYWSFYFDGSDTICKYSTTGVNWTGRGAVFKTSGVNETSIWWDSANSVVYAIGDTSAASTNVYIQKGTVAPATHMITWAASDYTFAASTASMGGKNTFISRDASGYLWMLSSNCTQAAPARYSLSAFRSTAVDSVAAWTHSGQMLNPSSDSSPRGSVLPAGSGSNVWAVYGYSGSVASRKYTGTWQNPPTNIYSGGGQGGNTEVAPPSALVDSKGVVHVVFGTGRKSGSVVLPMIQYSYNNTGATTFATPLDLDPSLPTGVGDAYPTISLETSSGDLYAFWLRTDSQCVGLNITAKRGVAGTWSDVPIGDVTSYPKSFLTSIYSVSGTAHICWQWTENTSAPIHVMFDKGIPEFGNAAVPMVFVIMVCAIWTIKTRRRRERADD